MVITYFVDDVPVLRNIVEADIEGLKTIEKATDYLVNIFKDTFKKQKNPLLYLIKNSSRFEKFKLILSQK